MHKQQKHYTIQSASSYPTLPTNGDTINELWYKTCNFKTNCYRNTKTNLSQTIIIESTEYFQLGYFQILQIFPHFSLIVWPKSCDVYIDSQYCGYIEIFSRYFSII